MAHRDQVHEDVRIESMQEASAALSIGVLFLVVSGIAGIFMFQTFRSGTEFWRIYAGILGTIGIVLIGIGMRRRRQNS